MSCDYQFARRQAPIPSLYLRPHGRNGSLRLLDTLFKNHLLVIECSFSGSTHSSNRRSICSYSVRGKIGLVIEMESWVGVTHKIVSRHLADDFTSKGRTRQEM